MEKETYIELIRSFVKEYRENNIINERLKKEILEGSTAWNKEFIMINFIKTIDNFRLYEEKDFSLTSYAEKFLSLNKPVITKE